MIALVVKQIAEGSDEKIIELGDISVKKEWTFAGDIARGILTLVEQEEVFKLLLALESVILLKTGWSNVLVLSVRTGTITSGFVRDFPPNINSLFQIQ